MLCVPPSTEGLLEAELSKVAENPQLAEAVKNVYTMHGRAQVPVDDSGAVKTFQVPQLARKVQAPSALPKARLLGDLFVLEVAGCLAVGLTLFFGGGARMGVMVVSLLLTVVLLALTLLPGKKPAQGLEPVEALHAAAHVRRTAASAVWKAAVRWAEAPPAGLQRGVAWRGEVAIMVESYGVAPGAGARYLAFILESSLAMVVHHYILGPGLTAAGTHEAAWGLRAFLALAGPMDDVLADDVPLRMALGPSSAAPKKYSRLRVLTSSREGARLAEGQNVDLQQGPMSMSQDPSIFVSPQSRMEKPFLGFGGSFTESSAVVFEAMTPEHQEEALNAYFNTATGAGYCIGRISMGSCDFGLGNWACGDLKPGDHKLKDFSIDHYEKQILPLYKRAEKIAGAPFWMLASPWSPPPWMKTKLQWNGDGHLRPDCGKVWAQHYVLFVQAMAKAGVQIKAVTVQNEPEAAQTWESCIYTSTEERDFVRDHLGPTLWEADLSDVKILIWDHNRDGMLERAKLAYADPEASKYIWGCAYHWYGDARFESWPERSEVYMGDRQRDWRSHYEVKSRLGSDNLRRVAELAPEKHILFTEGCQELSGVPLEAIQNEWKFAERYAMNIITDLNGGCEGWIDWNLFLNEKGGPNHVNNNCVAPIIYNTETKELLYTPPFYAMSHFSRFIRPGARRVLSSTSRDALEVTSFVNSDGTMVVVVLNQSGGAIHFQLKVAGSGFAQVTSPPNSITTLLLD